MSAVLLDKTEICLLLARLKWPIPGTKWWAMQELADLLADSRYQAQVEESLKAELIYCGFETEVVELLFVFWMAQYKGYQAQPSLANYVKARSVLSSMLLSELAPESLFKGDLSSPFLLAPTEFTLNDDFIAAQGRAVPLMFITKLKELEQETDFPFTAQYAFEWARSLARVPSQDYCVDYFLDSPRDEMTGQFVTQDSHRGRSAYLRTILIAKEFWEMPDSWATHLSLLALPINPTLADLRSSKPPWLHKWGFQGPATTESIAAYVTNAIDTCNRSSDNRVLAALSFPIRLSENEILDLNLTLWAQWGIADVDETALLSKDPHGYNGGFEGDGLVRPSTFSVRPIEELRDDVSSSAPAAGRLFPFRYGYLHTDIESRGWYVPLCTRANSKIRIQPSSNRLEFVEDKTTLGETGFWNAGWDPCHPKGCEPFCGTYLTLNNEHLPSFWDEPPTSYFYLWECKKLQRKQSHNSYNRECYGGIVRYDMTNGKS